MIYKSVLFSFSFFLLAPTAALANDAGPSDAGAQIIQEVWEEATKGGWKYTERTLRFKIKY